MKKKKLYISLIASSMIFNTALSSFAVNTVEAVSADDNPTSTIKDVVAAKNYILNDEITGLSEIKDLNGDGVVDIMDSILAKRNFIEDGVVSLMDFDMNIKDIYVGTTQNVTFSVMVYTETPLAENQLAVYDEDGKFIAYMIDDDEDNVYTADVELSSDERKITTYYCATEKAKSNYEYISYYDDITDEEIDNLIEVQKNVSGMEFNDIVKYIKSCDKIEGYMIDEENECIRYITDGGIPVAWEKSSEYTNGSGSSSMDIDLTDYLIDSYNKNYDEYAENYYSDALEIIESDSWKYEPSYPDKTNVICILPFDDEDSGDNPVCKAAAELTAKALNKGDEDSHYIEYSEDSSSVQNFRSLFDDNSDVGAVFIQSHGMFSDEATDYYYNDKSNPTSQKSYKIYTGSSICTSDIVYSSIESDSEISVDSDSFNDSLLQENDKDLQNGQLCLGYDGNKDCHLMVTSRFFKENYKNSDLQDTFWYLGSCHGLNMKGKIGETLAEKGATVIGYNASNSWIYNAACTMESIANQILLKNCPVKSAVNNTRNSEAKVDDEIISLNLDFNLEENDRLVFNGNGDFRLFKEEPESVLTVNISACDENNSTGLPVPVYLNDVTNIQNTGFSLFKQVEKDSNEYWSVLFQGMFNIGKAFQYYYDGNFQYYIITEDKKMYREYATYFYDSDYWKVYNNEIFTQDGFASAIEMECKIPKGSYLACSLTSIPVITDYIEDDSFISIRAEFDTFGDYEFKGEKEYYEEFEMNEKQDFFTNLKLHVNYVNTYAGVIGLQ